MPVSVMSHVDLERGGGGDDEGSVCFTDEGSCNSQFYSTADGDDYSFACGSEINLENEGTVESRRASSSSSLSMVDPSDLESGEKRAYLEIIDRDCRICHLSLVNSSPGSGAPIELGCSCKDDLAAAHKHCAETWFKIKGDKTCEICNATACNVVGPSDLEGAQPQASDSAAGGVATATATAEARSCINGHRLLNFLLACMVFAFVVSWLFHFNIPS